jgi:hypothetical protein
VAKTCDITRNVEQAADGSHQVSTNVHGLSEAASATRSALSAVERTAGSVRARPRGAARRAILRAKSADTR